MGLITLSNAAFDLGSDERVIGYYLYDEFEKEICDIRDLLLDEETHKPRYAIIEVGGLLSIKGKRVIIPWRLLLRRGVSRLDIARSEEEVMMSPAPNDAEKPTREEEKSVHSFFNIEPYWLTEEDDE